MYIYIYISCYVQGFACTCAHCAHFLILYHEVSSWLRLPLRRGGYDAEVILIGMLKLQTQIKQQLAAKELTVIWR